MPSRKATWSPTSKNVVTTKRPLELLHMDLFGPVAYISIDGSRYGLVIVDDFSRFTWVFFLSDKGETQETLNKFMRRAQNEFELKIKKVRSDNGTELKNIGVEEFLSEEGIKHEFSVPYTPQQNGCWGLVLKCYELRTRQHKKC
jgi:transposase InsO family protein